MKRRWDFLILGSGITARALASFFAKRGIRFALSTSAPALEDDLMELLEKAGAEWEVGGHSQDFLSRTERIVLSPSIRPDSFPARFQDRMCSELDLAQEFFSGRIVCVTGTNGKSTTVSLTAHLLRKAGLKAKECGNIGVPFVSILEEGIEVAVVEASSFQLFSSRTFTPDRFLITNITPDHLDWHRDMEEYVSAKLSPIHRMRERRFAFLNASDGVLRGVPIPGVSWFRADEMWDDDQAGAIALCRSLGIELDWEQAMEGFSPPPYRASEKEVAGLIVVNDSKATNPASTLWALKRVVRDHPDRSIVLICGGKGKKDSPYHWILPWADRIRKVVVCGPAQTEILSSLSPMGADKLIPAEGLREAIAKALVVVESRDVLLFSPMCSSFDEFKNYEERGRVFDELVAEALAHKRD